MRLPYRARNGFSGLEAIVSLGILATAMVLAAEVVAFSLAERKRTLAHQATLETALNILEAARGCPWDKLDDTWADAQKLPAEPASRWAGAQLRVRVESKALDQAALKRVTVEIEQKNVPLVRQTAWMAAREIAAPGGKP